MSFFLFESISNLQLKKCKVNANISAKLDEKKYIYSKIVEHLTKIAHQEMEKYNFNNTQVMYIPNLGFLLVLNKDSFYYSDISLNASYDINELESEIIHKLQDEFIKHSHVYANMIDICAELDCLLAFSQIAKEHDYVKPHLDMRNSMLNAKKVRHPLVEMYVEHNLYVPNDVQSGQFDTYSNKIKLITGPNASGKTVYLKQVALLVYMSMIGSYVAASEAIVGDFDRIFTRLNSNESVSMQLSAFSIDLEQMSIAINNSTSKSLVIVDEFGKGTDISDGQALIAAIIRFWINKEESSTPHIYFSTHFYEMLHNADTLFGSNNSKIEYLTFDYLLSDNASESSLLNKSQSEARHSKDIIQLYNLIKGIAKSSHAINILKKVGMPERLIKRAEQLYTLIHECMNSNDESLAKRLKKDLVDTPEADHFFTRYKINSFIFPLIVYFDVVFQL
jgi:DNA mismatch repair protein MSH5